MRVCWTGTFEPSFERNKRLREYLEAASVEYREVRVNVWPKDRVSAFTRGRLQVMLRMLVAYPVLLVRLLAAPRPDVYLVSYPGWFDVPVVKLVALIKRCPVVFDIFISLYDTAVSDRNLAPSGSYIARLARTLDRMSMRLVQRVIADCPAHARFQADLAGIPLDRFGILYIGADEKVFRPVDGVNVDDDLIVFYGTFVPLQGVEWIIRAAAKLKERRYRFRLIGRGQDKRAAIDLAESLGASNIEFVDFLPQPDLVRELASAALCLGIFGTSDKANHVIPHKIFEALACGRPTLTGSTSAVTGVLSGDVAVSPVGDASTLAESITRLMEDESLLQGLGSKGRARFVEDFSLHAQGQRLHDELEKVTR
jgi:glycosyltransferase involved in cell wall biosynthesis